MTSFTTMIRWGWPLLLLCLTGIAGYAYFQIRYLHLPISEALALFTVVLPLITGISTQGVYGLIQRSSKNEQYQLTIPLIAVIGFQLIYETIVATLSLTYILPPASLQCGLQDRWLKLFGAKNEQAIRAIQDAFNCCGLNTIKDHAYPFDDHNALQCAAVYNRNTPCLGPWRKAEQINAGLLLLVASFLFIVKVLSILSLLTSTSWSQPGWMDRLKRTQDLEDPDDRRASVRRLIEDNANNNDEGYHDEPDDQPQTALEAAPSGSDQGPRVQPSPLIEHGNEWRNE